MQHIVFFINILMVSLAVVPLVLLLARAESLKGMGLLLRKMRIFLIVFVAAAAFNVVLCYDFEIADLHLNELVYQFGWELLCFLKTSTWLAVLKYICQNPIGNILDRVNHYFLFIYGTAWTISAFAAPEHYWEIIEICDKILIGLCILGAAACVAAMLQRTRRNTAAALYGIAAALLHAISYIADISILGKSIIANNFYIFTWIGITVSTFLYLLYELKVQKQEREKQGDKQPVYDAEAAYDEIKKLYGLTLREEEILRELYQGKSNLQIAGDLNISEATVKAHIHNLLGKMNAASRVEAILTVQKRIMKITAE